MPPLVDSQHLLNLRLGLKHEVLGTSASHDQHAALPAGPLCLEHDAGRFVHISADIEPELASGQGLFRHVHADGAVSRRAGVDGHLELVRRSQDRAAGEPERPFTLADIAPEQVMVLRGAHRPLELRSRRYLPDERVGGEQHAVIEEDVVDADHALVAQLDVIGGRAAPVHGKPERKVGVVVEIGTGRDDPVDEPPLHQRNQTAHAEPGRRHGPSQRHPDRDVRLEHALGEELAALPQPAGVIRQEGVVDQFGDRFLPGRCPGIDALAAQVLRRRAGHRFSRAWITRRVASTGSSVTLNNTRSLASTFPSAATVRLSHSASPFQYSRPKRITGKSLTFPV